MSTKQTIDASSIFIKSGAAKHFVLLSYRAAQPGATDENARQFYISCFVVEAVGQWMLVTAGHIIEHIKNAIANGAKHFDFCLRDELAGNHYPVGVPFHFEPSEWTVFNSDEDGSDYAATFLSEIFMAALQAGGIRPITAALWGYPPFEQYEPWLLAGSPKESARSEHGKKKINLALLPLAPAPAPPGKEKELLAFGKVIVDPANDKTSVQDIEGMSGGPVFGIKKGHNVRYFVIGVQSRWYLPSRTVAFCAAYPFFHALQEAAAKRLEMTLMGSLPWRCDRVALRQIRRSDAQFMQALFGDAAVWQHLGGPKPFDSEKAARTAIVGKRGMLGTCMMIERLADAAPIGLAAFYFNQKIGDAESDFLIALMPEHQRMAYGKEILVELAKRWMTESKRDYCTAMVSQQNAPSINLLAKLGFTKIGECESKGGRSDVYRILAKDLADVKNLSLSG